MSTYPGSNEGTGRWQRYLAAIGFLNWKKGLVITILFVLVTLGHWAVYAFAPDTLGQWAMTAGGTGLIPALLFILGAVVLPLYLLLAGLYTIVHTWPARKYLTLSWWTLLIVPVFFLGAVLHNLLYALYYDHYSRTGGDEGILFIVTTLLIPLYFVLSVVYTVITKRQRTAHA